MALIYTRYNAQAVPINQARRLVIFWGLGGASLLAGYFAYQNLLAMLAASLLDFTLPILSWPIKFQFFGFIASVVVAGDFVWLGLRGTQKGSQP